ncbi:MAG: DUF4268 domain-containing protein [Saprospiraceae bacterium]|nr:DUF4268 domain-containing protein [Saprospiraceae bacterium]MBK7738819.1 DUF4268 domain-containing protein [Saprospiraceae bacterium]MBK7912608.1 DUF4268 domain-containing protein [Saprospiraceae bacterium]
MSLGKLKKVELREGWKHEAMDFTKWLAQEENLLLLSNEIGFDIKLIQTEAKVGSFNVDILGEEENTGHKIIIENQLEITNHDHLGKIITYASGYDARIIIWVVKDVREEHRRAIDWLNENTNEEIGFYLLKIELWQIADSPLAPKFEIISKPNDWAKAVKNSVESTELTDTKIKQLQFWDAFKSYAQQTNTTLRFQKSYPQHWTHISIGSSDCHISLTINSRENLFGVELYIPDNKDLYSKLSGVKSQIEAELSEKLEWMELPEKKASRIKVSYTGYFEQEKNWETYFSWLLGVAEKFKLVFPKYF